MMEPRYLWSILVLIVAILGAVTESPLPSEMGIMVPKLNQPATPSTQREEVIQSDLPRLEPTVLVGNDPTLLLPVGPAEQQASLSDQFPDASSLLGRGNTRRLVVLTASWCGPCQTYKGAFNGHDVSESFNAEIQLVDVDVYRHIYDAVRGKNSIPQTLWIENGIVQRAYGAQSAAWVAERLGKTTNQVMSAQLPLCPKCGRRH